MPKPTIKKKPASKVMTVNEIIEAALATPPRRGRPPGRTTRKPPTVTRRVANTGRGEHLTIAQRVTTIMGRRVMSAAEIMEAAAKMGVTFRSTNLRNLLSITLYSTVTNLNGTDGQPLRYPTGGRVKVHVFTAVERGRYQVTTVEERQREASDLLRRFTSQKPGLKRHPAQEVNQLTLSPQPGLTGHKSRSDTAPTQTLEARAKLSSLLQDEVRTLLQQVLSERKM